MPLLEKYARGIAEELGVVAQVSLGDLWNRLLGEGLAEWTRLNREGIAGDDLERRLRAHLEGLSEKPLDDVSRKSAAVAYNQGRAAEIESLSDRGQVEFVVRSEILDDRTCEVCAALDGQVVEVGSDEFFQLMPPARCLGDERCRGFYVPVAE